MIFFMLTSTLVSQNALNLKLPSSSSKTVAPQSIAISIEDDGKFYFNGKRMGFTDIERNVRRSVNSAGNKDNVTISIFSEKSTPIEYVVKVMDMANRMKLQAILAVEPGR